MWFRAASGQFEEHVLCAPIEGLEPIWVSYTGTRAAARKLCTSADISASLTTCNTSNGQLSWSGQARSRIYRSKTTATFGDDLRCDTHTMADLLALGAWRAEELRSQQPGCQLNLDAAIALFEPFPWKWSSKAAVVWLLWQWTVELSHIQISEPTRLLSR